MTQIRRFLAVVVAVLILGPAPTGWAGEGGNDAVIAVNTTDGSKLFRFAFKVRRVAGDVVDTSNVAVAYSNCESCQTVAIAIQLVLVSGQPEVVTPQNLAIAINEGCLSCETLASAYQFVLGGGEGRLRFTNEGKKALHELRRDLAQLRRESLPIDEIQARVEGIVDRLKEVLATELVRKTKNDDDDVGGGDTGAETTPEQPQSPTETQTTEAPPTTPAETTTGTTEPPPTEPPPTEPPPTETAPPTETVDTGGTTTPATTEPQP
jgi:putative peptide zinc metalloprotease protein